MPIYQGETQKTLLKGDYRPAEFYKGSKKITGYDVQGVSGEEISIENTYNDTLAPTVQGNGAQDGTPTPDSPVSPAFSEGKLWSEGRNTDRPPTSITLPVLRAIPDGNGGFSARDSLTPVDGMPGWYDLKREVGTVQVTRLSKNDTASGSYMYYFNVSDEAAGVKMCSHFRYNAPFTNQQGIFSDADMKYGKVLYFSLEGVVSADNAALTDNSEAMAWLQAQAEAGTPLTVWYPLETPTTEQVELGELSTYPYYTHIYSDCAVKPQLEATVKRPDAYISEIISEMIQAFGVQGALSRYLHGSVETGKQLTPSVERFFEAAASTIGETYTSQFYKYSAGTTTEGIKLDDNAGLTCIPSTIATAGTDDYANLPLFACFDCNYTIDADTLEPVIHAIKDVYGEFTSTPTDSFVGVLQMTGWVRRTSGETTKTVEYKAQKADGFEPLPEAVRALDNTVRSFVIHAKYAAGYNSAGLLSSVSGVQPATLRTGSAGSTSISHNGQIAKWREWGLQYCGSSLCDIAFVQLMLEIKYAVLGSAQVMQGCRSYSTDTYQAAVAETGVTRVLLTAANAAFFVAGSCVSLGTGNNRAAAACYDICDISKIASIEDVTVDDVAYKAINLDTETTFNTTTDTYIIPQPWRTGSTDDVPGNDGSPYSNTSGKEPFKIQGIELMLGFYEVPADTTLYEDTEKYTVYLNRKASEIALGGSGTNPVTVGTIPKEETASWGCVAELNWDANNQEAYMLAQEMGGSTTTGYRARVYRDAAATTGWREWPAFGYLKVGGSGGFACAGLYAGIGTVGWDIGARACGSGGNRGGFASAYEEGMNV